MEPEAKFCFIIQIQIEVPKDFRVCLKEYTEIKSSTPDLQIAPAISCIRQI